MTSGSRSTSSSSRAGESSGSRRQKYRMNVTKASTMLFGSKFGPNDSGNPAEKVLPTNHLFIDDPRASSLRIDYSDSQFQVLPSNERFSAHTGSCWSFFCT